MHFPPSFVKLGNCFSWVFELRSSVTIWSLAVLSASGNVLLVSAYFWSQVWWGLGVRPLPQYKSSLRCYFISRRTYQSLIFPKDTKDTLVVPKTIWESIDRVSLRVGTSANEAVSRDCRPMHKLNYHLPTIEHLVLFLTFLLTQAVINFV